MVLGRVQERGGDNCGGDSAGGIPFGEYCFRHDDTLGVREELFRFTGLYYDGTVGYQPILSDVNQWYGYISPLNTSLKHGE